MANSVVKARASPDLHFIHSLEEGMGSHLASKYPEHLLLPLSAYAPFIGTKALWASISIN